MLTPAHLRLFDWHSLLCLPGVLAGPCSYLHKAGRSSYFPCCSESHCPSCTPKRNQHVIRTKQTSAGVVQSCTISSMSLLAWFETFFSPLFSTAWILLYKSYTTWARPFLAFIFLRRILLKMPLHELAPQCEPFTSTCCWSVRSGFSPSLTAGDLTTQWFGLADW